MNVFWIVIILLSAVYFCVDENRHSQKWWYISLCTLLLVLTCIRNVDIGYDSRVYADYFLWFRDADMKSSLKRGFEPGYVLLNKFIGYFTGSEQVFIAVLGILTLIPLFLFIWKKSTNPILSLLIFVVMEHWFSVMGIFRQWCAVAILTLSYDCIIKRKLFPFLVCVIIAFTFHQTALFFLPLYFLYPVRITPFKVLLCMTVAVVVGLLSDQIVDVISLFARNELLDNVDGGMTYLLVLWMIVIAIILIAGPIINSKDMKLNYMALIYSAVIQPLSLSYSGFARIHLYCWFGLVLVMPQFLRAVSYGHDRRNILLFKVAAIALFAMWYFVTSNEIVYVFM